MELINQPSVRKMLAAIVLPAALLGFASGALAAPKKSETPAVAPQAQAVKTVSINQAGLEDLQSVRGIGPALADRIMKYRAEHGRFERVEDLTNVSGIGEAKFEKIKSQITL